MLYHRLDYPRERILGQAFSLAVLISWFGWQIPGRAADDEANRVRELPAQVLYYGVDESQPKQVPLRAGPLTMVFEAGDLRYIKLGEREVLRRWYAVTRDRNWGTLANRLSNLRIDAKPDSFHIRYDVENQQGDIHFNWKGEIVGDAQGTIQFTFDGTAHSDFLRNRIGFCLLHPSRECPGAKCRYERADGTSASGEFPRFISPENPFQDLKAFSHEVLPGVWAHLRFTGDAFEMEDQRNWIDASFKTFCTPLRLPYPVEVKKGTRIQQTVTLKLEGAPPATRSASDSSTLTFGASSAAQRPLLQLGLGSASHGEPLGEKEIQRLRVLRPAHLRVDLRLNDADCFTQLHQAAREAAALDAPLEIAVFVTNNAEQELKDFSKRWASGQVKPDVCRWLVFHADEMSTTERWVSVARRYLRDLAPGAKIGAGTNAYFTQLNRGRPPVEALDLVCYSINPQVHAFDNRSLVETLEAHVAAVESARQFIGPLPLAISPVTLKPRFNPNATGPAPPVPAGELPPQVDVRQMSLFGAGWTLGSIKYLAESGAESATFYETTGWRGVMETKQGSPVPGKFRSIPGTVYPLYHVLADIAEFRGGHIVPSQSSDPLSMDGLILKNHGQERWWVANLTDEPQTITLKSSATNFHVLRLNEKTAPVAIGHPEKFRSEGPKEVRRIEADGPLRLQLLPYETARVDIR